MNSSVGLGTLEGDYNPEYVVEPNGLRLLFSGSSMFVVIFMGRCVAFFEYYSYDFEQDSGSNSNLSSYSDLDSDSDSDSDSNSNSDPDPDPNLDLVSNSNTHIPHYGRLIPLTQRVNRFMGYENRELLKFIDTNINTEGNVCKNVEFPYKGGVNPRTYFVFDLIEHSDEVHFLFSYISTNLPRLHTLN